MAVLRLAVVFTSETVRLRLDQEEPLQMRPNQTAPLLWTLATVLFGVALHAEERPTTRGAAKNLIIAAEDVIGEDVSPAKGAPIGLWKAAKEMAAECGQRHKKYARRNPGDDAARHRAHQRYVCKLGANASCTRVPFAGRRTRLENVQWIYAASKRVGVEGLAAEYRWHFGMDFFT